MSIKKKKITISNIISLILLIIISINSFFLTNLIYSSKDNLNKYEKDFYSYWSETNQSYLNSLEDKLELNLNNNPIDISNKDDIKNWIFNDSDFLLKTNNIDNFIITDLEYELDRNVDNFELYLENNKLVDENNKKLIISNYQSLLNDYYDNNFDKNKIMELLENYSKNIALKTNMSYNDIEEIICSRIIGKERIIFSLSDSYTNEIVSYQNNNESFTINIKNDKLWIETMKIPTGLLGINEEPKFLMNGTPNINYNKISVYISVKESNALYSFNSYEKSCNYIIIISEILLIIISVFSIIIILLLFIDILKLNRNGGDINANKDC